MKDIEANSIPEPNCGCWLWLAGGRGNGYGTMRYKGRSELAHRVSYFEVKGEIPEGLEIDHRCRNKWCVNPDHLEAVTHAVNIQRAYPLVCKRGHPLVGDNLIELTGRTVRRCKTCHRERQRKYNHD